MRTFINLLTRIKGLEKHYIIKFKERNKGQDAFIKLGNRLYLRVKEQANCLIIDAQVSLILESTDKTKKCCQPSACTAYDLVSFSERMSNTNCHYK